MAAHRTWGVFFMMPGVAYVQLSEAAFLNAAGTDLSVGGYAGASSENSASYAAAYAFDKNNSTDWCTTYADNAARLWYVHPFAVDVAKVRIRCSSSYSPTSSKDMQVCWSDDLGVSWSTPYRLTVESGSFAPSSTVVLTLAPPFGITALPGLSRLEQNFLQPNARSIGVVSDRVVVKTPPSGVEVPFANGLVRLYRAVDGYKAWEGRSDANGYYTATGLEAGVEYIAVGIDPYRNYKVAAAGPVVAVGAA